MSEEQLEAARARQKESPGKQTLAQALIQEGAITVRALKTLHSVAEKRREAAREQEAHQRRMEKRKQRTRSLIPMSGPPAELPMFKKQDKVGLGVKKAWEEGEGTFKPLTLRGLKEDFDELVERVEELEGHVKSLLEKLGR
jgi:hypothetical protein